MAPCLHGQRMGPASHAFLFLFDLVRVDDVGDVGILIDILDQRVVFLVIIVVGLFLNLDVDILIGRRLVGVLVGVLVLEEIGISGRLVVERHFLDLFLLFFLLLVGVGDFLLLRLLVVTIL